MPDSLGRNRFDTLVEQFQRQGLTRAEARKRARIATQPRLTPPPGTKQQQRKP